MSVRSDTVSSASASSARMRSRVASPAALSAVFTAEKGSWAGVDMGRLPIGMLYKDIFIPLREHVQGWLIAPQGVCLGGCAGVGRSCLGSTRRIDPALPPAEPHRRLAAKAATT